ncbi:MAG: transaldolase [Arenimonas sp.]
MKPTQALHELGQSLWLDNITRDMLDDGTLRHYIEAYSVTGLTSNPSIFDAAIEQGGSYDADIRALAARGVAAEPLFLELALADLRRAADLFAPVHARSGGVDGWVSMEVSPLLVDDIAGSVKAALAIHAAAQRDNLFVKIPATPAGVLAIEEAIFAGVPINVTLLFDWQQYQASANAYLRGIERRIAAGLDPRVASVASLFISRWDAASHEAVPEHLRNKLGLAVAGRTYRVFRELLDSPRWRALAAAGALPQRLLWASTGTKDPSLPTNYYVAALAAPGTIDTIPEKTLLAFDADADSEVPAPQPMAADGEDADAMLARFGDARIDISALATRLQRDGAAAFVKSWNSLLGRITAKSGPPA